MIYIILTINIACVVFLVFYINKKSLKSFEFSSLLNNLSKDVLRIENSVKDEIKTNRSEIKDALDGFQKNFLETINNILNSTNSNNQKIREEISKNLNNLSNNFQNNFDKNINEFKTTLKEKLELLEAKQNELVKNTEKKLEEMRLTVEEKLQKTLSERIGQSFAMVSQQLDGVQKGLGEMQTLATDVGGLKKVLANVKMRGTLGEVRLESILEQILSPEQYRKNETIKTNSKESVEFVIVCPDKIGEENILLPIDSKFPLDAYNNFVDAFEKNDIEKIEKVSKELENQVKKMAKDIRDKYIDPPHTTDYAILFLPFESLYAEIIRRSDLMNQLQYDYKVIVTGPTTLSVILNSFQMGFRTLNIQKRSGEIIKTLGAVKKEFYNFETLLTKVQNNLKTATNQLDELSGKRTRAIQRVLKEVELVDQNETDKILPELSFHDKTDEVL